MELVGYDRPRLRKTRKAKKKGVYGSALNYTPFRSSFRWRRY